MGFKLNEATASSTFSVIFTAFISLFQVFIAGRVKVNDFLFFSSLALFSSFFIAKILRCIVNKFKRPSIILIVLSIVVCISLVVLPASMINSMKKHPDEILKFGSLCN